MNTRQPSQSGSLHPICSALPEVAAEWQAAPFRLHRPTHIAVAITSETTEDAISELEWMIERLRGGEMNSKGRGGAKAAFFAWSFRHEPNTEFADAERSEQRTVQK